MIWKFLKKNKPYGVLEFLQANCKEMAIFNIKNSSKNKRFLLKTLFKWTLGILRFFFSASFMGGLMEGRWKNTDSEIALVHVNGLLMDSSGKVRHFRNTAGTLKSKASSLELILLGGLWAITGNL
ncbi:MAG: hypothetical protein CM1200mP16_07530 [Nitrospina sp.]|nr:MAG: hypothetical protein CM1200mP16_07530 [Nitrospina sp.]